MPAKIYSPSKNAMQSGKGNTKSWVIEFEPENSRSIDPLMGWTSNSDTKKQLKLKFKTLEDAVKYAENNRIDYILAPQHKQKLIKQTYAENFIGLKNL